MRVERDFATCQDVFDAMLDVAVRDTVEVMILRENILNEWMNGWLDE